MADQRPEQDQPDTAPDPAAETSSADDEFIEEAIEEAQSKVNEMQDDVDASGGGGQPMDLPRFDRTALNGDASGISLLSDVNLHVKVELGRTRMYVEDVLRLNEGAVVELDKPAGDPVDIYVNNRHVARGEVLVVNDNFCVRISEIIETPDLED